MQATFKHCKNWRTFPGVHPLNSIAADNKIFPAGVSLINGWLLQVHSWPQWLQCCLMLIKVPICWVISVSQYLWHDLQAMNRLSRWDFYTRNLTLSWCCDSWVSSLCDIRGKYIIILPFLLYACLLSGVVFTIWAEWCILVCFSFSGNGVIKWHYWLKPLQRWCIY